MKTDNNYIVAGAKSWNRRVFDDIIAGYPGRWHFTSHPDELSPPSLAKLSPRYIFFLHWSWKVPDELIDRYECICFHMTDVPYGRGGSPLQNLILRGHLETKLTALRMTHDFDAGPVYQKEDLSLEGSAEEIYVRATDLAAEMIQLIIREEPVPVSQTGEVVVFKRRKPFESEIKEVASLQALYNFIRMLDAEGYPKAFIEHKGFRYEFSSATLYDQRIVAAVTIIPSEETN